MTEERPRNRRAIGGGALVLFIVAVSLWNEFREPANVGWNVFLAVFLVGLAAGAISLQLYFRRHPFDVGEARFDTANKSEKP